MLVRAQKKEPFGLSLKKKESGNRSYLNPSISVVDYLKNSCSVSAR